MPSEMQWPAAWTTSTVEQLTLDGAVTYGVVQPGPPVDVGRPMLRVNNFRGFGLDTSDVMHIASDVEAKYSRTRIRADDVLMTVVGSVGQVAVVPAELTGWNLARAVALLRPRERVLARWIALCLRSPPVQHRLGMAANTTVQTTINLKDLRKLELPMPPAAERVAIEEVLCALDDRIDLLRQTNATLESIAQALFKSWFIDFDPVRAKAEGREPEGMDAATATLFPAEFEESALGLIPKGWTVERLSDLLELAYGKALKSTDRRDGQVPVYGSGGITGFHDEPLVPHGSVIVGRKGTVGSLYWEDRPFFPIDTTFYVKPKTVPMTFCFYALQRLGLESMNTDAAVPGLNRENAYRLEVTRSNAAVMRAFDDFISSLRQAMRCNGDRAALLESVRDSLLPRLISGKLLLQDFPAQHEEALT